MAKTLDDFMGLTNRQQFVMAMYLFVPYQLETTDLQRLTAVTGTFDVSIKALNQDLSFLARHRWIEHADNYSMDYTAAGTYPAHTLRAILDIASKQGWLPDPKQLADAMESPLRHSYTTRNYKLIIRTAELIRLLLTGSGKGVTRELTDWLKGKKKLSLIRGAVFRLNSLISDDIDFRLSGSDDPLLPVMRFWLNIRFICGKDIRPLLQTLHDLKRTLKSDDDEELERMFASLCVWTGCGTWIPDAATLTGPVKDRLPFRTFIEGCRCVMEGNMATADACFRKVEAFDVKERNRSVDRWCYVDDGTFESRKFDNLPERLLVATVAAVAKPDKIAKGRPAEIMSDTELIDYGVYQYAERTENHYLAMIAHTARLFKEEWRPLVSGKDTFLLELKAFPLEKMDPVDNLLLAWNYRMLPANRSKYTDMAAKLYVFAKTLAGNGYLNLAWLMVCLLPGAYDPTAEADFLVPLKQHAVQFLPIIQLEPEWKAFLKHFGTAIGKAVKSQKRIATVPSVRWLWQIVVAAADNGCYRIDYLMGAVRREGDPEDGSRDQRFVSEYDLNKAATKGFMSERDLLIERTLRGRYGYGYHDFDKNTMRDLLGLFCGIDNLETVKRARPSREFVNAKPVRFIAKKCELETAVTADGGMRISLPEWVIHAESDRILRKIDESTYAVVEITKEAAKLIEILSTFDTGHKGIEIPAAGMGEALPLLEAAAEILPVAAPSEKERDKLPKVKGNTGTTVRLSFTEGTLSLRAVVKPLADNPSFVLDPGMGQAERMVSGVAGSYILTRDLAAEKAHFERVKETLAACESWFDGKCAWMIDDISVALSALMALKTSAAEPEAGFTPPVLEWIDDRRITVVNVPQSGVTLTASKTAEEWFRVNGTFTLDDGRVLSVVQMLEAMPTRTGEYVRLTDGAYARLTKAMARQLEALGAASRRKGDGVEVVKAAIPMLDDTFDGRDGSLALPDAMAKTAEEIRGVFANKPTPPKTLTAELRPYQEEGYRWLSRLAACGFGSCLADDMGLGKTVQTIALLIERAADGPTLVVTPSSVCGNWRNELCRFAPTLEPVMAAETPDAVNRDTLRAPMVVIASYGYLLFHADTFAAIDWNGVILDEAQAIKNDASKRAKIVKRLHARFRVAVTGTPVENRLGELWSLFDFLNPGLLGAAGSFATRFTVDGRATAELKRLVKPLILRRLKGDVLEDLPEKTEITLPVELGVSERTAYEGCRVHALAQLRKNGDGDDEPNRISILAELTRLRRFCCHPSLVLPDEEIPSAKMEALLELLSNLRESRHRALVFSQFTDYLAIVKRALDARKWSYLYLDGATPTLEREKRVNAFQTGEGDFFLISLKAGGTGLNLTAANYVILLDPWWNPAVENQAADRAHRIGQKNPVTVYRLIAADTVEERVIELHNEKREMAEDVLDGTGSAALTPAQLLRLFS